MSRKERKPYAAPALSKGLEILELLAGTPEPLTQGQIARRLERSVNEQFRMLAVLEESGYVRRDEWGAYHLTLKLFILGNRIPALDSLVAAARGPMRQYVEETGQECHLSCLQDGNLIVLSQQMGWTEITLHVRPGTRCNPFRTASGRLLLSELDREDVDWHWIRASRNFPQAMPDREDCLARIEALEASGMSRSRDESLVGLADCAIGLGAPACRAALASSWFHAALGKAEEARLEEVLRVTVERIESQAGLAGLLAADR